MCIILRETGRIREARGRAAAAAQGGIAWRSTTSSQARDEERRHVRAAFVLYMYISVSLSTIVYNTLFVSHHHLARCSSQRTSAEKQQYYFLDCTHTLCRGRALFCNILYVRINHWTILYSYCCCISNAIITPACKHTHAHVERSRLAGALCNSRSPLSLSFTWALVYAAQPLPHRTRRRARTTVLAAARSLARSQLRSLAHIYTSECVYLHIRTKAM